MVASTSPGWTVSPSRAAILPSTPLWSAATSTLTFSVSSCTSDSPASTASPSRLSQAPTVASTTDSPSTGTRTSTGMSRHPIKHLRDDAALLGRVRFGPAFGRTGALGSADIAQCAFPQHVAQAALDEGPGPHILGLFLQPDHFIGGPIAVQELSQRLARKW